MWGKHKKQETKDKEEKTDSEVSAEEVIEEKPAGKEEVGGEA